MTRTKRSAGPATAQLLLMLNPPVGPAEQAQSGFAQVARNWLSQPANCEALLRARKEAGSRTTAASDDATDRLIVAWLEQQPLDASDLRLVLADYAAVLALCLAIHPAEAEHLLEVDQQLSASNRLSRSRSPEPHRPVFRWAVAAMLFVAVSALLAAAMLLQPATNRPDLVTDNGNRGGNPQPAPASGNNQNAPTPTPEPLVARPELVERAHEEAGAMLAVTCFTPDGQWLLGGGVDGAIRAWSVQADGTLRARASNGRPHAAAISALTVTPSGYVVSGDTAGRLLVWKLTAGPDSLALVSPFPIDCGSAVRSAQPGPGARVCVGLADGRAVIVPLERPAESTYVRTATAMERVSLSDDGHWLAMSGDHATAIVAADRFRAPDLRPDEVRQLTNGMATSGASPERHRPLLIGQNAAHTEVSLWQLADPPTSGDATQLWSWQPGGESAVIRAMAHTADASRVATDDGATIHVRLPDGTLLATDAHEESAWLCFSPDGRWLAVSSRSGGVRLLELTGVR